MRLVQVLQNQLSRFSMAVELFEDFSFQEI